MTSNENHVALDAQNSILGAMLIDARCVGPVLAEVKGEDFDFLQNREIFSAIHALFTAGQPIDPVTVLDRMKQSGGYTEQSYDYVAQLIQVTPTAANVMAYVRILKERQLLHRIQLAGMRLASAESIEDCQSVLSDAQGLLADRPGIKVVGMSEAIKDFYERHDPGFKPVYLPWGMDELDSTIHAFPGSMIVIGGYPSDGKTSLAARFAAHMAQTRRVGFFSYETSVPALFDRIAAMITMVPMPQMQQNKISEDGWDTIAALIGRIGALQLDVLEAGGMTVSQIRALALSKRYDVIFVDYLQKITPAQTSRWQSSFEAVSQISNDLQQFGRQTGITVVALSQLSRPERSKGITPPPTLSSLRQSGQIEQDADAVILLYREEPEQPSSRRILKIAKNKDGAANAGFFLDFDGETQTFRKSINQEPKKKPKKSKAERDEEAYSDSEREGRSIGRFAPTSEPIPQEVLEGWNSSGLPF